MAEKTLKAGKSDSIYSAGKEQWGKNGRNKKFLAGIFWWEDGISTRKEFCARHSYGNQYSVDLLSERAHWDFSEKAGQRRLLHKFSIKTLLVDIRLSCPPPPTLRRRIRRSQKPSLISAISGKNQLVIPSFLHGGMQRQVGERRRGKCFFADGRMGPSSCAYSFPATSLTRWDEKMRESSFAPQTYTDVRDVEARKVIITDSLRRHFSSSLSLSLSCRREAWKSIAILVAKRSPHEI